MSGLLSFFTALPQLLTLIIQIGTWINKVSGNDPAGWALSVSEAFKTLNNAKSDQEHSDAAKVIADLIRGLK